MCNEYARVIEAGRIIWLMEEMKNVPPFAWTGGQIPNDIGPKPSIKIQDKGIVIGLSKNHLSGRSITWGWKTRQGKPVFNFISEKRSFAESERVLIPATGFFEYTEPVKKTKLKDKHFFTLTHHEWFWIAGIVKYNCFTMLTTQPGPDIAPYHDRQICVLPPEAGMDWLTLSQPESALLRPAHKGALSVTTLRKDGEVISN